ncbi:hypothetical protein ARMSODRAFT_996849 [Armillaria solidipes]|uniref:Amidohydrolase-related domain-containing protein n=1 Tax=Armillaria solidipes TaxID=1076256 RepID=A0A2H3B3C6_9AGAR|nr:hypothetical protein ARMSODRAFT_996849 [Armillaria solidipes]
MGKNNKKKSSLDTHTHLPSTFALYCSKYPEGEYETAFDFVEGVYAGEEVETVVDVWCEPEVFMRGTSKELADGRWEGIAKSYTTAVESEILTALLYPFCIGLDVQQQVFAQQLRIAVVRGIPITVPTQEAEEDTERIMKEITRGPSSTVYSPNQHLSSAPYSLLHLPASASYVEYFPNLHIGMTQRRLLRIEPQYCRATCTNVVSDNKRMTKQSRLPFSLLRSLTIPWTAEFVGYDKIMPLDNVVYAIAVKED